MLRDPARRARRLQAPPAQPRQRRRADSDQGQSLRPGRSDGPGRRQARRPSVRLRVRRRPSGPIEGLKATSTLPRTTSRKRCTAIASSCASSAIARTAAPKAASSRCSSARAQHGGRPLRRRSRRASASSCRSTSGWSPTSRFRAARRADAEPGQMVTVEVTRWPTPTRGPAGRIVEVLGDIDDPGVDTEIILRKHGIPDEHRRRGDRGGAAHRQRGQGEGHRRAAPTSAIARSSPSTASTRATSTMRFRSSS